MTQLTEQPNAAWARFYVAQGFAIIPIHVLINGWCSCGKRPCGETGEGKGGQVIPAGKNAGKHPVQARWTDPAQWIRSDAAVHRWWGDPQGLPYSIGIVCGQASGTWILDVDPRNGGFESLERLEAENEVLPETRVAETGSGGKHFFFLMPEGKRLKKGPLHKDYPGIDIQADGAQSVLAPSTHVSGKRYSWETPPDKPILPAPTWLVGMVDGDRGSPGAGLGGAKLDLPALMQAGVPEGQRNDVVHKVSCYYARKLGVGTVGEKQLVVAAVEAFNREFVRPPLELDELQKVVGSAVDFIAQNPGTELPAGVKEWLEGRGANLQPSTGVSFKAAPPAELPERPDVLGEDADDDGREGPGPTSSAGGDDSAGAGDAGSGGTGGNVAPPAGGAGGGGGGGGPVAPAVPANNFGPQGLPPDPDSLGPDGTPGDRTYTDNGNARRIVDSHEDELRYTPSMGWRRWDGLTWRVDEEDLYVTALARELPPRIVSEVAQFPQDRDRQTKILKHATDSKSSGAIRRAVALANSDPRIQVPVGVWDSDADLLGVQNGVVDLRTGRLIPPARDQYITKRTAVAFEPRARDTRLQIWLDQASGGDRETQKWLQRWAGYCLTGETLEEKFLMLYGPAGTGKSTFLELVKACAGDYGFALTAENIMQQKFAKANEEQYNAQIFGKRVLIVSELLEAEQMKEDSIKRLTGGDTMTGRFMRENPFQFRSRAKLMIGTNNRPRVTDNAMWRRLRLLPFHHVPPLLDPSLKPYLLDPAGGLPAFLAWAVEGTVEWYMSGLGTCGVVEEATAEYREAEDELGIFLREELRAGEGLQVGMADVYQAWKNWLEDRGGEGRAGPINKLMRRLGDRGLDVEGSGRRAVLLGWTTQPRAVPESGSNSFADLVGRARF